MSPFCSAWFRSSSTFRISSLALCAGVALRAACQPIERMARMETDPQEDSSLNHGSCSPLQFECGLILSRENPQNIRRFAEARRDFIKPQTRDRISR